MVKPVFVVPFYNHAAAFESFALKLAKVKLPVVVVNDGSSVEERQKLGTICQTYDFECITLPRNGGKGVAVSAGLQYAYGKGYTHAIQIDADGQHDLNDIEKFLSAAKKNPQAIICGAPIYDASAPKGRLIGRQITRFWVKIETFGANITDTMCGYRVYPLGQIAPLLKHLHFMRMGFDIEILVKSAWRNIAIINVPTKVIYPTGGVSHFKMGRDNFFISLLHTYLCCQMPVALIRKGLLKCKTR